VPYLQQYFALLLPPPRWLSYPSAVPPLPTRFAVAASLPENAPYWQALLSLARSSPRAARALVGQPALAPDLAAVHRRDEGCRAVLGGGNTPLLPKEPPATVDLPVVPHAVFGMDPRIKTR